MSGGQQEGARQEFYYLFDLSARHTFSTASTSSAANLVLLNLDAQKVEFFFRASSLAAMAPAMRVSSSAPSETAASTPMGAAVSAVSASRENLVRFLFHSHVPFFLSLDAAARPAIRVSCSAPSASDAACRPVLPHLPQVASHLPASQDSPHLPQAFCWAQE